MNKYLKVCETSPQGVMKYFTVDVPSSPTAGLVFYHPW